MQAHPTFNVFRYPGVKADRELDLSAPQTIVLFSRALQVEVSASKHGGGERSKYSISMNHPCFSPIFYFIIRGVEYL